MKAIATWNHGFETRLEDERGHTVIVDLEKDEGGEDAGTSSLELMVLSLAGCIATIFALVARKRRVLFASMSVSLDAERPRGAPTLTKVEGEFHVTTTASVEDVETALNITLRTCPVGVLFDKAGVPVHVRTVVSPPPTHAGSGDGGSPRAGATSVRPPSQAPAHSHHHHGHGHGHGPGMVGRAWSREEAIAALESPDRRRTQDPEELWNRVSLARGETVVEVGAGTGYFALPAARRVGPEGRVYASDLSHDLVALLRERGEAEHLHQLQPIENTIDRIPLDSGVADLVLLANVLHDIPESTLEEAVRLLKPGGRLVNLDWKPVETPGGPPLQVRLTPEQAAQRLSGQGLTVAERFELGPWHYGLVLRRRAREAHGAPGGSR